MLTVKYISEFGFEQVFSATDVSTRGREYDPHVGEITQHDRPNFVVDCKRGPNDSETFRDGQIYVMNDAGKTVANYDLRYLIGQQGNRATDVAKTYATLGGPMRTAKPISVGAVGNTTVNTGTPL